MTTAQTTLDEVVELITGGAEAAGLDVSTTPTSRGVRFHGDDNPRGGVAVTVDDAVLELTVLTRAGVAERTAAFQNMPAVVIAPIVARYLE